jgi:hypothetical protein
MRESRRGRLVKVAPANPSKEVTMVAGSDGPFWGRAEHSFAEAAEDAIHRADEQGLFPEDVDVWHVELFVQTERHSPSHVQWFRAKLTAAEERPPE